MKTVKQLALFVENKPGTLAAHKVNIEYAYSATPPGASHGTMILRVDNLKKAARVLRGH